MFTDPEVSPELPSHKKRGSPKRGADVRSNSNLANGFKSRSRSCPYALIARRSGVWVIKGREFLTGKDIGRYGEKGVRPLNKTLNKKGAAPILLQPR